jgi:PAS domain S-box-containing protein
VLVVLFGTELILMRLLPVALPDLSGWPFALLDAGLLSLSGTLAYWQFLGEPLRSRAEDAVQQSAGALHSVVHTVGEIIFRTDSDGRWTGLSPAWTRITGIPVADALGQSWLDAVHPEDRDAARAAFDALRGGAGPLAMVCRMFTSLGEPRWLALHGRSIRDIRGHFGGCLGTLRDVTQAHEAEAALASQARALEILTRDLTAAREVAARSASARNEGLVHLSHQIRAPMHGVLGMVGLLLDTPLESEQHELAVAIQQSADALLDRVNDGLDCSRLETGTLTITPIAFDLRVAVDALGDTLASWAREKGLQLIVRVAPEVPRQLRGDVGRIRQILRNLVGNAVAYTQRGHVLVNVELADLTRESARVIFAVEDTGIGIPADLLETMLGQVASDETGPARPPIMTGLGLVRRLTQLMDGRLGGESSLGGGSRFWVEIPLLLDASTPPAALPAVDLAGLRALIADGVETSRQVLVEQLEGLGLRPCAVATGAEALTELNAADQSGEAYHLLLTSEALDDMDGAALGRLVRSEARLHHTVMFYLATQGRRGDGNRVSEAGFNAYFVKPLRHDDLQDGLALAWTRRGGQTPLVTRHLLAEARAAALPTTVGTESGVAARVVLAEDNPVNQLLAIRLLERLGCRVELAANGREALEILASTPVDLVFMDCEMPELDGLQATRLIRSSDTSIARTPIIALTANGFSEDREQCLDAGMDDYLAKPINPGELAAMLERWGPRGRSGSGMNSMGVVAPELALLEQLRAHEELGGPSLVEELCVIFLADVPRRLVDLARAAGAGDARQVQATSHAIKGAARLVGARPLSRVAEALEHHARGGGLRRASDHLMRMEREFEKIRPVLERALKQLRESGSIATMGRVEPDQGLVVSA